MKDQYFKILEWIRNGEDEKMIRDEFDAARAIMDSIDTKVSSNEQIPKCFRVAWDYAYEELSTSINCRPETQLKELEECIDLLEYFKSKHYI